MEFCYDTQQLMEGQNLSRDTIYSYITRSIPGNCLLVAGDETLVKLHYHTNLPWKVLEYCAALGEIYDVVVEHMGRQSRGLQG